MCLGIPAKIVEISDPARQMAVAEFSGVKRAVCFAPIIENNDHNALVGSWVLVHVGFAMSRIDEAEANATLKALSMLGEMDREMDEIRRSSQILEGTDEIH